MPLSTFYPLLTLISIVVFAFVGWVLARKRYRNAILWPVLGALLPPLLIILFFMKPAVEAEPSDEDGELDEG